MKICVILVVLMAKEIWTEESALTYATALIASYSATNTTLSRDEFRTLFKSFRLEIWEAMNSVHDPRDDALCDRVIKEGVNIGCSKCMGMDLVFDRYAINSQLNSSALLKALPAVVLALKHEQCQYRATHNATLEDDEPDYNPRKPTTHEIWGYSFGVVLLVCLISNLGAFLSPMMGSPFFQKVLNFLVAVAIGTQAGAGILVLLPESLHLMYIEETADTYLWKVTASIGGILFVLLLERILKICFHHRKTAKERVLAELTIEAGESTVTMVTVPSMNGIENCDVKDDYISSNGNGCHMNGVACVTATDDNGNDASKINGFVCDSARKDDHKKEESPKQEIATIAWMVLLGDAIHKFVDGLSVGAAFTETFSTGLTLAISIICEEIPHELGDISILLHSGMTMKQALVYNTLSAACGIPGVITGVLLGGTPASNQWIFAISAGIFIYVPLADMLPEMSHVFDKSLKDGTGAVFLCVLQLIGLCMGFGVIVLVAHFAQTLQI